MLALITGATSGFGEATAIKFARENQRNKDFGLILTGRRKEKLEALQKKLVSEFGTRVHLLSFDISSREACVAAIASLPADWKAIDLLVNNAGLAREFKPVDEGTLDDWDEVIDTNIKGLLYITHEIIPGMKARKSGHIINMGSTAAKDMTAKSNIYAMTKSAVDAFSKALRIDLLPYRIKVTAIHPGAAETEFSVTRFQGDEKRAKSVYDGLKPLVAEDLADIIYYTATLPAHVCINDLVVTCTQQANSVYFDRDT